MWIYTVLCIQVKVLKRTSLTPLNKILQYEN